MNKASSQHDDIDFEIGFYQGVIDKRPEFIEALVALGDLYTRKRMLQEGLKVDERLSMLRPADPFIMYNLACSYSLLNECDKALRSIKKAINCGYDNFEHLEDDSDLNNLKRDRRFQRYYGRIREQYAPVPKKKAR